MWADAARFRTTSWSLVVRAVDASDEISQQALERLCRGYWPAVHAFISRRGYSPEDAKDLTQTFFARLLEKEWLRAADATKGRFRTFLLTAVTRFLGHERERNEALKRGGGVAPLSLDIPESSAGGVREPADHATPELAFERRWAETLLNRVLDRLRNEFDAGGRAGRFQELKSFLTEDRGETSYAEVAVRLGLSESAVKSGIHRLRQRYGELVREEIAETVESPDEVESEIRHLVHILGS
jgi:RNA polymerase sigma factor (sigma-70 family)